MLASHVPPLNVLGFTKNTYLSTYRWGITDILSVSQFSRDNLDHVFSIAEAMRDIVKRNCQTDLLKGKILANVFFEASTRTSCSFHAAMLRLGGSVIPLSEDGSSAKKGETLADTIRCLDCYCDAIVLRHPAQGSAAEAARFATKPVLNAGDGVGEHPTQALLDIFTMLQELTDHDLRGKTIAMVGDLRNGRTVHSLARLLMHYENVTLHLVSPRSLRMPRDIIEEISTRLRVEEYTKLHKTLPLCDIMYVTRVQKERFPSLASYEAVKDIYYITEEVMSMAKSTLVLMHPLPRVGEISLEVDDDPRAAYFRQMENGMYVRMALLALVMKVV